MTSPTPLFAEGSGAAPSEGLSEERLVELTTKAMRAFEPLSSVLRYREADKWHTCDVMGMRAAVRAIWSEFAPILAEKEREYELASEGRAAFAARALAAEAALAAERERCAKVAEGHEGLHCGSLLEGPRAQDYDCGQIDASTSIAAAIRAQGE